MSDHATAARPLPFVQRTRRNREPPAATVFDVQSLGGPAASPSPEAASMGDTCPSTAGRWRPWASPLTGSRLTGPPPGAKTTTSRPR